MKVIRFVIWYLVLAFLQAVDAVHWQLVIALAILPLFFIGKPWYSYLKKPSNPNIEN